MTRFSLLAPLSFSLICAVPIACDTAAADDAKARAAQVESNNKQEAAIQEAELKINRAQTEADQQTAAAQADFMRMREDYRHATNVRLVDLDRRVADLTAKSSQLSGKPRIDLDANLKHIHASRDAFDADYRSLESLAASGWDAARTRLDKEWTDLKALVDKA
jgi:hypothetical protein